MVNWNIEQIIAFIWRFYGAVVLTVIFSGLSRFNFFFVWKLKTVVQLSSPKVSNNGHYHPNWIIIRKNERISYGIGLSFFLSVLGRFKLESTIGYPNNHIRLLPWVTHQMFMCSKQQPRVTNRLRKNSSTDID